jgi:tetratricopeptide (TPR) repeat protein
VALSASLAFATDPVSPYPVCNRKTSAADQEGAKGAHKAASQFYDRGDYEKAIRYWTDAYGFDCNAHGVLINIANAYEKKGDKASAVVALETYLKRAGSDQTIEEKVKNLRNSMQPTPTASATPSAAPSASGTGGALPPPSASASSAPPPPEVPVGPRPFGVTPLIVAGGGGALALVGVILLPVGLGNVSAAEKLCPNRDCGTNTDAKAQGNSGRTEVGAGAALLGIGLAAAAGGLAWQFIANKPKPLPAKAGVQLTPVLGPQVSGLTLSGTF